MPSSQIPYKPFIHPNWQLPIQSFILIDIILRYNKDSEALWLPIKVATFLAGLIQQALNIQVFRKFIEALYILAPSIYIVEDVYKSDLVVYIRVYVHVIIKALMKFNTRYIAKKLAFAVFDLPRHPI